jgi:hypothetical protein
MVLRGAMSQDHSVVNRDANDSVVESMSAVTNRITMPMTRHRHIASEKCAGALRRSITCASSDGQLDLAPLGLKAASSTWIYLVNDDPFDDRFGCILTGAGGLTVAMYSSVRPHAALRFLRIAGSLRMRAERFARTTSRNLVL